MENACLRIKFQPLYKNKTIDNSVCCLEIVPVVSCIQNLDKLIWRQEKNYIEYSIPMTYKVVLQKWPAIQEDSDRVSVKTYHSCVDLLLTSSTSMIEGTGSGDISKIISDTFIVKKCLENSDKCTNKEYFARGFADECKYSENDMKQHISNDTTNTLLQQEDIEKKETETNTEDDQVQLITSSNCQDFLDTELYNKSLDKITNTETVYTVFGDTPRRRNVLKNAFTAKSCNKYESTRLLSLSSICSVNTQETPLVTKMLASKAVSCKIRDPQRDLVLLRSIRTPSEFSEDYQDNRRKTSVSTIIDVKIRKTPKKHKQMCPEMRVVECVQYMEREILPLKMWLNDIKRKCTELGIEFDKTLSEPSMIITKVSNSNVPEMMITGETTKSNRAVYSIVFDG